MIRAFWSAFWHTAIYEWLWFALIGIACVVGGALTAVLVHPALMIPFAASLVIAVVGYASTR